MQRIRLLGIVTLVLSGAVALSEVAAWAQEREPGNQREGRGQREGGRRGPGFGGGGSGGPGFGARGGGGLLGLVRIDKVREELKISEDQQELIQVLADDLNEGRPEFPRNFRELSEAERDAAIRQMAEWRAKQDKEAKATLATVLEPDQYQRLMEINIQTQGANALTDEEVAAKLGLTDEQKTKIASTIEENREASQTQMREVFSGARGQRGEGGFAEMREKMEAIRKEGDARVLAVLTEEQKTAFAAMQGKAFELPEPRFGGGPGGPGARGFGGRGGEGGRGGRSNRPDRPRRPE